MKSRMYIRIIALVLLLFSATYANAQSDGDKLFIEGQNLQKVMTVKSQNAAIKKFHQAKVVYTSADKKIMCDNQISICRRNINDLKSKPKKDTKDKEEKTASTETKAKVEKRQDVSLSLSETRLDFKYKPKEGATQSVKVICNYDDWTIAKKPDWVEVYTGQGKISVEVAENTTDSERSGIVVIKCDDVEADLIINQSVAKTLDKISGRVKGLFKKKKK